MTRTEEIELSAKGNGISILDLKKLLRLIDPHKSISPIKIGMAWKDFCKSNQSVWLDPTLDTMSLFVGWLLTNKIL